MTTKTTKRTWLRSSGWTLAVAITLALGAALAQEPESVTARSAELYNAGDIAALVAEIYGEDAVLYDADGTVAEGKEAIRELLQGSLDAGFTEVSFETIETEVVNDTAYEIGRWTLRHDEGEVFEGYYLSILRRENGEWRIHRDFFNLILPEEES